MAIASSNLRTVAVGINRQSSGDPNAENQRALNPYPTMHLSRTSASETPPFFVFPFPPQQIQYSNISPEITEIARPGKRPLIAFSRFRAKQIAFRFLLAVPNDGLYAEIDTDIQTLQEMANTARPVYFTNFDRQISNPIAESYDNLSKIFWSITDLTFSSIRRNARNQIVAAEANITLVENNNPVLTVAELPRLTYTSGTPAANPRQGNDKPGDLMSNSWSQTEAALVAIQ